ncbi:hypothetical protein BIFCAT_01794 [Bifidobacterium catenulatum DSM 16992 = JCM 1194 = LMG 11043]|uniref:Uncharacterized protein n=1 Tax=Bifidobacterium catenulatum DSM 16992 = JCM 1194 = LMG 11043 TaxID=566552 RepID=B6XXC1_9BIFI|nr:hypothetical protein BIFCAT_01794 [Bifidobacterium catenulatum DSM 16992 = JCM 1194 = LMG 11043]
MCRQCPRAGQSPSRSRTSTVRKPTHIRLRAEQEIILLVRLVRWHTKC